MHRLWHPTLLWLLAPSLMLLRLGPTLLLRPRRLLVGESSQGLLRLLRPHALCGLPLWPCLLRRGWGGLWSGSSLLRLARNGCTYGGRTHWFWKGSGFDGGLRT